MLRHQHWQCDALALASGALPLIAGDEMVQLWREYEEGSTEEAKIVKDFDKVPPEVCSVAAQAPDAAWPMPSSLNNTCRPHPQKAADASLTQIEMILQAHEYESAQGMRLQEFFNSTHGKWRTELGRRWAEEVCRRREAQQAAEAKPQS